MIDGEIDDWREYLVHIRDFTAGAIVLSLQNTLTQRSTQVEGGPQSAFHSTVSGGGINLIKKWSPFST